MNSKLQDIYQKQLDLLCKSEGIILSEELAQRKLDLVFRGLMDLSFDDEDFDHKHSLLTGQHEVLTDLMAEIASQRAGINAKVKSLRLQAEALRAA